MGILDPLAGTIGRALVKANTTDAARSAITAAKGATTPQVATDFSGGTYLNSGSSVTVSSTPTTIQVASTSNFPLSAATAIIGTGAPGGGGAVIRVAVNYTGMDSTHLTGVTTIDGNSYTIPNLTKVWYSKSGLSDGAMVIPNQIITGTGADNRPHDLVLTAAFDPTADHSRGDYDIILTREAGSYGVCWFNLPIGMFSDTEVRDGVNRALLTLAAGTDARGNAHNPSPLPIGTIAVAGTVVGDQGTPKALKFKNSGAANSKIYFVNSADVEMFRVDENGPQFPNNTYVRINGAGGNFGALSVTAGNTFRINMAGSGGWEIVTPGAAAVMIKGDQSGNLTIVGGLTTACRTISANATLTAADAVVICATGLTQVGLPSAVTAGNGRRYTIKNKTASTISVVATAGAVDLTTIATTAARTYVSDGADWWSI